MIEEERESWEKLAACLRDDGEKHERFIDRIENTMNHRQRVNIAEVSKAVAKELGSYLAGRASEAMWTAARRTDILIEDPQ